MSLASRQRRCSSSGAGGRFDLHAAQFDDVAERANAEGAAGAAWPAPRQRRGRPSRGAGPLQDAADRAEILDRAGQIAVAGPGPRELVEPLEFVVLIDDLQGDRAAERRLPPHAAEDLDPIGLDPLAAAAPVAALAPVQLDVDRVGIDGHAGRKTVDDGQQGLAVRFAGGPITQHGEEKRLEMGGRDAESRTMEAGPKTEQDSFVGRRPKNPRRQLYSPLAAADRPKKQQAVAANTVGRRRQAEKAAGGCGQHGWPPPTGRKSSRRLRPTRLWSTIAGGTAGSASRGCSHPPRLLVHSVKSFFARRWFLLLLALALLIGIAYAPDLEGLSRLSTAAVRDRGCSLVLHGLAAPRRGDVARFCAGPGRPCWRSASTSACCRCLPGRSPLP